LLNNEEAQSLADTLAFSGAALTVGGLLAGVGTGGIGFAAALLGACLQLSAAGINLVNVGNGVLIVLNPVRIFNPVVGLYPISAKKKKRAAWQNRLQTARKWRQLFQGIVQIVA